MEWFFYRHVLPKDPEADTEADRKLRAKVEYRLRSQAVETSDEEPGDEEHYLRIWAREKGFLPPKEPRPQQVQTLGESDRYRRWALGGLDLIAKEAAALQEGERNDKAKDLILRAGRMALRGGLDLSFVRNLMFDALVQTDLPHKEINDLLDRKLRYAEECGPAPCPTGDNFHVADAFSFDPDEGIPDAPAAEQRQGLRIETIRGADVRTRTAEYVWTYQGYGSIQRGTLALAGGRPGAGKSTWARSLAAGFTRGRVEGCWHGQPQNVAYVTTEESLEYTVAPSLRAAGADMGRVFFPDVRDGDDRQVRLLSLRDEAMLGDWLIDHGVTVLVVDPIMSTISGKTDINRNNEVRACIEPWARIAQRIDGVVIGIAHLNKAPTGDVVAGINGSSAFGEVARSVFGFAKDPDSDDGLRVMSQAKNSTGPESMSLLYRIESATVTNDDGGHSEIARFILLGDSDRSVSDILRNGGMDVDNEAVIWLRDYLELNGRTPSKDAKRDALKDAGHSASTVKRAAAKLRVVTERVGFPGQTYWSLPLARANTPDPTGPTDPTGSWGECNLDKRTDREPFSQSAQWGQSDRLRASDGPTADPTGEEECPA